MKNRTILHIILWLGALVCFGMAWWSHYQWTEQGGRPDDPGRYYWMIYGLVGIILIAVWFFTREKEEEISITRS